MPLHNRRQAAHAGRDYLATRPQFARAGEVKPIPRFRIPDSEMDADTAYQIIHDELIFDGSSRLNLATFVTTWMDPQATRLMAETLDKNMIDKDEYPQTAELELRCVHMIADLWNASDAEDATGTSTIGSSEAVMLGGLAMLRGWRKQREAAGKPTDKPNVVAGINVQVAWEKYGRYWDVELKTAPMAEGRLHLTGDEVAKLVDENTIGVIAILGSTFDGSYEPVKEISEALDRVQADTGIDVPIHVDAASGGFVAPFIDPDLEWDFRVPRVRSINASGHKYGLVYPGVGWVIWRDRSDLPDDLVFHVNYLGGDMPTFALNFSRPGSQVVAQYYNLIRLGRTGYTRIQQASRDIAMHLSGAIAEMPAFELLSRGDELPVFAFKVRDGAANYTVYDLAAKLRERGWLVPSYSLPADLEDTHVIRIVVRNGFSRDMADILLEDIAHACRYFESLTAPLPHDPDHGPSFHH
jgi:glutamate decarboxylase